MKLIKDRDLRTIYRKMKKKEFDERINMSVGEETSFGSFTLLDEGMVVDANGNPDFFIKKGTLSAFLSSLSDDYEGAVKFGHQPLSVFPIVLGTWRKPDLTLVEGEDGRESLEVDLKLNTDLNIVKDMMAMPYTFGISVEMTVHYDYEASELLSRSLGRDIPVVDGINIMDYAIVGEAGNVNSSDITLKGGTALSVDLKALSAALDEQGENKNLAEISDLIDQLIEKVDGAETEADEVIEEAEVELPEVETPEEVPEEVKEELAKESEKELEVAAEEEKQPETVEEPTVDLSIPNFEAITKAIEDLRAENEALKNKVATLTENLSVKEKNEREFIDKFKTLSIKLSEERKPEERNLEVKHNIGMTNGIGEL